ncbi:hypothetical protein BS78_01G361100 [Paspalum vaginatum]|nr:hypothetical protein BS78_01G361100 [Paspalum vaginatum]
MVASALAQEGVSLASSFISTKLDDKASTAKNMARLEMALSHMEFYLESAGKIPITYISLLRRAKILKSAQAEGTHLLNKHKLRVLQDKEQATGGSRDGRAVTRSYPLRVREWIGRARKLRIISSLIGLDRDHLSSATVQIFERYADEAERFVAHVESANPLGRGTFRYPFVRELLEGKTLWYGSKRGSQLIYFDMWPLHSDDRGVEAMLRYGYNDLNKPENCFFSVGASTLGKHRHSWDRRQVLQPTDVPAGARDSVCNNRRAHAAS